MIGGSAFWSAWFPGDLLGSWLYQRSGLGPCLAITAAATALIFPLLPTIPGGLISWRDGEALTARLTLAPLQNSES